MVRDEIEAAASIVSPVTIDILAEVLGQSESTIIELVEALEAENRVTAARQGVSANQTSLSATRLSHLAGKLAEALVRRDAPPAQVGLARLAAGDARGAHADFVAALSDGAGAEDRLAILTHALDSGTEARVSARELAPLRVERARALRNRGEHEQAVADLDAATPHLSGEELTDALGFAAALHDDRQHPADAERTIAMALLVAAREGLTAKLGSLLTFQGRLLARLGFDAETERVFDLGTELIDAHGNDMQRYYSSINRAWTDLDRGWVARAEQRYTAARDRALQMGDHPVAIADLNIAIARAKFASGDASGALDLLASAREVAAETGAPVLRFLGTLAEAEGAIAFHQPVAAVEASERLTEIVSESFPAWRNRAATIEARALVLAQRKAEAREAIRRGFETTPHGANGIRLRTELEALQLVVDERWDDEGAADVADRLLQGGWLLAAVALLTERARKEKRPEFGRAAAALAHRIGAAPAAADAIEAADMWKDPASGSVSLAIQRAAHTVPEEWEERWKAVPAIDHALGAETSQVDSHENELLDHLDAVLAEAGLGGAGVVLSPAQRRAAGLVKSGSAIMSMGRFVAWVTAAAIVAAVVAIALRPEPVVITTAAPTPTAAPTTTIPPLFARLVDIPGDLGGQNPFAGGDARNAYFDVSLGEPTGVYLRKQLAGFIRSEPVLRGRGIYLGTSEGWVYGLDITQRGATVFESQMPGAVGISPTTEQVVFQQDDQGKVLNFIADDRGNLLVRHINDTEGEVYTLPLGSPVTGPPLVRPRSLIVATEEGVLYDFLPSDGADLRRFPEEGEYEGGFEGAMAADDGYIYIRTGEGAVVVIDEETFTEVCSVFSIAARATTHPVVAEGRWYVGTSARTVRSFTAGGCSDAGIGSFQIDTPVLFAPVIVDGVLWASAGTVLMPLDVDTGQIIGRPFSVGATFTTPPVVAGDLVLVTTDGGQLVAVSRTELTEVWRVELGEVVRTRPVVANDLVLIATPRGELIAIAAPAG
jgi:outer membrane protein assembly factor BamB